MPLPGRQHPIHVLRGPGLFDAVLSQVGAHGRYEMFWVCHDFDSTNETCLNRARRVVRARPLRLEWKDVQIGIKRTIDRIPGGMMLVPLALGSLIVTLAPGTAAFFGSFTGALFSGALPILAVFYVCLGATISFDSLPHVLRRGGALLAAKLAVGIGAGILLGRLLGENLCRAGCSRACRRWQWSLR